MRYFMAFRSREEAADNDRENDDNFPIATSCTVSRDVTVSQRSFLGDVAALIRQRGQ